MTAAELWIRPDRGQDRRRLARATLPVQLLQQFVELIEQLRQDPIPVAEIHGEASAFGL